VLLAIAGSLVWVSAVTELRRLLPLSAQDSAYALHWSPFPYATGFVMGIAAYRIRQWRRFSAHSATVAALAAPMAIFAMACLPRLPSHTLTSLVFSGLSFALIVFGDQGSSLYRNVFCNRAIQLTGTISYGIYLSHMPLLRLLLHPQLSHDFHPLLGFAILTTCTLVVSALGYIVVEQPSSRLVARFTARIARLMSLPA